MCDKNVGCVLVADVRGDLVGIVTDRDLACSMATAVEGVETPLSEIMTPRPVSIEVSADIEHVIHIMEESGIRRMPVVEPSPGGGNRCIGIVTLDDLVAAKMIDYDHLTRVIRAQIRRKWLKHYWKSTDVLTESRSEAHMEQTLNRFYKTISERVEIPAESLVQVTQFLLGCLIRRLHYTGAAKFVAQLPKGLQEELLDLPAGPDRGVDRSFMHQELTSRFGFSEKTAHVVIERFFLALIDVVNREEMENVMAQLPEEFRVLFRKGSPSAKGEAAA